jgi:hypothetical protein
VGPPRGTRVSELIRERITEKIYRYQYSYQESAASSNSAACAPWPLRRVHCRGASRRGGRHVGCEGLLDRQHHLGVELGILGEMHDILWEQQSVTTGGIPEMCISCPAFPALLPAKDRTR